MKKNKIIEIEEHNYKPAPIIIAVEYIKDYVIKVVFKDGVIKIANLKAFFIPPENKLLEKYSTIEMFKTFHLSDDNIITWGDNEVDINPDRIYNGEFE